MKKISAIVIIICLLLQGCVDFNHGKRPSDYKNTRWVSETPDIYFEVNEDYDTVTKTNTYGKITEGENEFEITVLFDYGNGIVFCDLASGDQMLRGTCKFSDDTLVVKVTKCEEEWCSSVKKITFSKESRGKSG